MSQHTDICDAVVTDLNAEEFSQEFTATRKYLPWVNRNGLPLTVTVSPGPMTREILTRTKTRKIFAVDIAVQKGLTLSDGELKNDNIDPLHDLLEEIAEFFEPDGSGERKHRLTSYPEATWEKTDSISGAEAGYAWEHLEKLNCYTGIIRVTFAV